MVVEDGPTATHGGMNLGAGFIIAQKMGAEIIDPRPFAAGGLKKTFEKYSHLEKILPAMGYSNNQLKELEDTINKAECDYVIAGTPIDLKKIIK